MLKCKGQDICKISEANPQHLRRRKYVKIGKSVPLLIFYLFPLLIFRFDVYRLLYNLKNKHTFMSLILVYIS